MTLDLQPIINSFDALTQGLLAIATALAAMEVQGFTLTVVNEVFICQRTNLPRPICLDIMAYSPKDHVPRSWQGFVKEMIQNQSLWSFAL